MNEQLTSLSKSIAIKAAAGATGAIVGGVDGVFSAKYLSQIYLPNPDSIMKAGITTAEFGAGLGILAVSTIELLRAREENESRPLLQKILSHVGVLAGLAIDGASLGSIYGLKETLIGAVGGVLLGELFIFGVNFQPEDRRDNYSPSLS